MQWDAEAQKSIGPSLGKERLAQDDNGEFTIVGFRLSDLRMLILRSPNLRLSDFTIAEFAIDLRLRVANRQSSIENSVPLWCIHLAVPAQMNCPLRGV
jgi:hypothetical protein